jgi:hypothetical protein
MRKNRNVLAGVAIAVAALGGAAAADATAFSNGNFESCIGCNVSETGFAVLGNAYWAPESGSNSVALGGLASGSISQTFTTIVGQKYDVQFYISGAPNPVGFPMKKIAVTAGPTSTTIYTYDDMNTSSSNMNWQVENYTFVADSTSTTLTFSNVTRDGSPIEDDTGATGDRTRPAFRLALDNVTVTAVPEPAIWAMMILGFGFTGCSIRLGRGKRAAAAA